MVFKTKKIGKLNIIFFFAFTILPVHTVTNAKEAGNSQIHIEGALRNVNLNKRMKEKKSKRMNGLVFLAIKKNSENFFFFPFRTI